MSSRNTISTTSLILDSIDALEIIDFAVGGKSITLSEPFTADDQWLINLQVRVKNVSSQSISVVQMNLFLPEIMPGGPMVTLCYGCDVANERNILSGEEVELRVVFPRWVVDQINSKSSPARITKAEIDNIIVKYGANQKWLSGCMRTASRKNACPAVVP